MKDGDLDDIVPCQLFVVWSKEKTSEKVEKKKSGAIRSGRPGYILAAFVSLSKSVTRHCGLSPSLHHSGTPLYPQPLEFIPIHLCEGSGAMRAMGPTCHSTLLELDRNEPSEPNDSNEYRKCYSCYKNYLFLGTQISGSDKEAIRRFNITRHLSSYPVAVRVQW